MKANNHRDERFGRPRWKQVVGLHVGMWVSMMMGLSLPWCAWGEVIVGPWQSLFKGVEHAVGKTTPGGFENAPQVVNVLRIDLLDPDVELFATPALTNNYVRGSRETGAQSVSSFLEKYGVQAAVNACFYEPNDVDFLETPMNVLGLHVSQGNVVSVQDDGVNRSSVIVMTNRTVQFVFTNTLSRSTAGIHTAVTGRYPLVINGVNVGDNATSPISGLDPRTAIGATEDGRYLLLMTVDGRQSDWSVGSIDEETAEWMIRFGAHNAVNVDGGGSTTMSMSDNAGNAVRLNRPSYLLGRGRERYVGSHLGVKAKAMAGAISDFKIQSGGDGVRVSWNTARPATTRLEWGVGLEGGEEIAVSVVESTTHSVTLSNLLVGVTYCLRVHAKSGEEETHAMQCFQIPVKQDVVFRFNQVWRYTTNNLDGVSWMAPEYAAADWLGQGPGLLYVEDNSNTGPKGTLLPPKTLVNPKLPITYYFRTSFVYTNEPGRLAGLVFSNYIDDGAVFYLNGREIQRVRMPEKPAEIKFVTLAKSFSCTGDATVDCPTVFAISGDILKHVVRGTNWLAVEVHNYNVNSPDVVFGTTLIAQTWLDSGPTEAPVLGVVREGGEVLLTWEGAGYILQSADRLGAEGQPTEWKDLPGPVNQGPYRIQQGSESRYFRLRN